MSSVIEIIINQGSGTDSGDKGDLKNQIEEAFKGYGLAANVSVAESGEDLMKLAEKAAKSDAQIVVAGGGDGTISAVASRIIETDKTFGVLPLGTLNHFAKDLQIPLELEEAVRVIAAGHTARVDAGQVNGRVFINNSSIGLYPSIVRRRERQQRLGRSKWTAAFWAAVSVVRRYPFLNIKLKVGDEELRRKTPFAFVGNNEYEMESFSVGGRTCLDAGNLSLYILHRTGRIGLIRLAISSLFGRLRQAKDFDAFCTSEAVIETRRARVLVAFDGEVEMMDSPLRYSIRPAALRVIVPENGES